MKTIKEKYCILDTLEAPHITTKSRSRNKHSGPGIQWIRINYRQHCLIQPVPCQPQDTRLQEELEADSVGRN